MVPQPRDRQPPATPPPPTPLSPSFPSNLYKHVQNSLNNGRWENHACFFFYAFFLFPFFKLCDHLKCCERSDLPFCRSPPTPFIHVCPLLFLFSSPYIMICLLPPTPPNSLWFDFVCPRALHQFHTGVVRRLAVLPESFRSFWMQLWTCRKLWSLSVEL